MITIKEEFIGCAKWERAVAIGGSDAIVLWLALKAHAATHLTDGFVSSEDMRTLRGAPKRPRKALQALIGCGGLQPDGTRGPGLVDIVDHGYQLHDYLEHAESRARILERRGQARDRKRRQRGTPPCVTQPVPRDNERDGRRTACERCSYARGRPQPSPVWI